MDAKAAVLCQVRKGNCETTSDSISAFNLNTSISFGSETRKHRNSFKKKRRAFSLAVCVAAQSWFEFHKLEFFHMTLSEENIRCWELNVRVYFSFFSTSRISTIFRILSYSEIPRFWYLYWALQKIVKIRKSKSFCISCIFSCRSFPPFKMKLSNCVREPLTWWTSQTSMIWRCRPFLSVERPVQQSIQVRHCSFPAKNKVTSGQSLLSRSD